MGKSTINGPSSIATLNYQRVSSPFLFISVCIFPPHLYDMIIYDIHAIYMPSLLAETVDMIWYASRSSSSSWSSTLWRCDISGEAMPLTMWPNSIISESLQQPRRPLTSCNHNHASSSTWDSHPSRMTWKWPSCLPRAQSPLPSLSLSAHIYHQKPQPKPRKGSDETIWVMFLPSKFEVCSTLFTCNMSSTFGAL